ncbi:MAG: hypothetical protein N2Z74_00430, partial [Syntrophales bacterium]|nr:hypothetical protein [Syntrophales bacterium]
LWWLMNHGEVNGIFNLGTGRARSWNDLAAAVFSALGKPINITYIDMPPGLEAQYQYFTEAVMDKLKGAGCPVSFRPLEDAIQDYVVNYLMGTDPYL